MGWYKIAAPGTKYGPCLNKKCGHVDCAQTRQNAMKLCKHCQGHIGYERAMYFLEGGEEAHASCQWRDEEKGKDYPTTYPPPVPLMEQKPKTSWKHKSALVTVSNSARLKKLLFRRHAQAKLLAPDDLFAFLKRNGYTYNHDKRKWYYTRKLP